MLYPTTVLNSIFYVLKECVVISVTAFLHNPYGTIDKHIKDLICNPKIGILVVVSKTILHFFLIFDAFFTIIFIKKIWNMTNY